jgi:hypothetical protein
MYAETGFRLFAKIGNRSSIALLLIIAVAFSLSP